MKNQKALIAGQSACGVFRHLLKTKIRHLIVSYRNHKCKAVLFVLVQLEEK